MNRWMQWSRALTVVAILALPGVIHPQQDPKPQPLVMTAENLTAGDDRHREAAKRSGDANALLPGDVVRYRLAFTNLNPDSLRNVQFTNPLPTGLRYVAGSASADRSDVTIEYSIDAGRTWSEQPTIEELVDGKPVRRPAPVEKYTNVRWTVRGWVKSKSKVTAEYRAELPAPSGDAAKP
jgi:uncharacterized repeat protein (TIGR01451 family)